MTTHPAAYVDWVCPGCKTLYEVDPEGIEPGELCDSCQREEDERACDFASDCEACDDD